MFLEFLNLDLFFGKDVLSFSINGFTQWTHHRITICSQRNNHFVFDTVWTFSVSAHKTTRKLNYLVSCQLEVFQTTFVQNEHTEEYEIHQRSKAMNILHVDDSTETCQMYADMLALGNHTVKSVNDGR